MAYIKLNVFLQIYVDLLFQILYYLIVMIQPDFKHIGAEKILKSRSRFLQSLLCFIIISSCVGCDSPNAQKQPHERLVFNVDETRLEPMVTDTTLRIKMAAPKNWKKIDNSILTQVINKLDPQLMQEFQIVPRWIFLNEGSQAMCVVSKLNGVEIAPDETLLKTLTTAYQNQFPKATVQQAVFIKDAFRIHQLMVIATDFVRIKLICDAPETFVFQVDYHIPKGVYQTELRSIESSIGSINLIHKSQ